MNQRLGYHLKQVEDEDGEVVTCRNCGEELCPAGENYKEQALAKTMAIEDAGPLLNDPSEYVDDEMEFRQFYCPGCATLLENEVILADLDPIHDSELQ